MVVITVIFVFNRKKIKTVLNTSTGEKIEVPPNMLKHLFGSKAFYQYLKVFLSLRQCLQN